MKKSMIMVCGKSGTGKTMTLRNLRNPKGVWYFNCEGDPELPFEHEFTPWMIDDATQVVMGIEAAEDDPSVHTLVIDTMTFFLDMYVNKYVVTAPDPRKEWGNYNRWVHDFMIQTCAKSSKNIIILAHTVDIINEDKLAETKVIVPGNKINVQGFEAYFNMIVGTAKMRLEDLPDKKNNHLIIDEWDKATGFKHVIQTFSSADSTKDRLRGKYKMWQPNELFIDNDIQIVLDRLNLNKVNKNNTTAA